MIRNSNIKPNRQLKIHIVIEFPPNEQIPEMIALAAFTCKLWRCQAFHQFDWKYIPSADKYITMATLGRCMLYQSSLWLRVCLKATQGHRLGLPRLAMTEWMELCTTKKREPQDILRRQGQKLPMKCPSMRVK